MIKILAIDDNQDILTVLKNIIADAFPGSKFLLARSGQAGIEQAQAEDPDVILLDINMPGIDGFEVCRRLKKSDWLRDIPVIFLTGLNTCRENRIKALEAGAEAFLYKPIDEIELPAQIRAMKKVKEANRFHRMEKEQLATLVGVRDRELKEELVGRKLAEEDRERMTAAIEQAGEVILIADSAGIIQYVNPAFEKVTGYSREEAIGQNPRILKSGHQDLKFYKQLWKTIISGGVWSGRMVNQKKDGTFYTEDATISPVRDAAGHIINFVAVKRDITENLKLTDQLQQAQKMESVGRLAGGVAHDFNNMLSVILGFTELAIEKLAPTHRVQDNLSEIYKAAKRSTGIVQQLLAFARKQAITPMVLNLNDTVTGMVKMLRRLIGEDIALVWRPVTDLWPIMMDPSQFDQLLANLCVNARDAIHDVGTVTIEIENVVIDEGYWVNQACFLAGEFVKLTVKDTGCGMDRETVDKIFEPFFTTKETGKGTGLGLSTVYGIIKQNDGFVNVYSELGQGTTFSIYLPRHVQKDCEIQLEDLEESAESGSETILLVEDDLSTLKMTTKLLESMGYKVLPAITPAKAIFLANGYPEKIHLLMTDVIMPEMNGQDLAKKLLCIFPHINRLFMSGYTSDVISRHGVLEDGVHFIQKPFSRKSLADKLKVAIDR